ncbi:MAG: hypothetical protein KR126chlam6_00446 [Candidatus Anoxychlamydiales bacterium]|nr:hypothetical protein [Candidatus Anoxychlamydiales bacterium]
MYPDLLKNLSKTINKYFSEIEAHFNFELGPEFEIALCKILKDILPNKYGVCRGFIVAPDGKKYGDDIIIYDRLRFPTIRMLGENNFAQKEDVPFEAVYSYIEAKHNLELGNEENSTLKKALKQIQDIHSLKRPDRPINQITEIFSAGHSFKTDPPAGWAKILNPLHTCIFSRKTSAENTILDADKTYKILIDLKTPLDEFPDIIVAGDKILVLPVFHSDASRHIMPFLLPNIKTQVNVFKTKHNALAVGLCQLLWALSRIELGTMPWEQIIVSDLQ